jgi:hypothetical protein
MVRLRQISLYNIHVHVILPIIFSLKDVNLLGLWVRFQNIGNVVDTEDYRIVSALQILIYRYSQICIKRSSLGQSKSGLLRQVTSKKRFILYDRTRKR